MRVPAGLGAAAAVFIVLAAVAQGWGSGSELGRAILSQEIGAYGTSTDSAQQQETDRMYDSTFQSDPGHISRAELRFNAALRAAGVSRGGMALTTRRRRTQERPPAKPVLKSSPASGSDWVAYPDGQGRAKEDVTINIYGKQQQLRASGPPHRASPRRMSASEARRDLFGYFDGISSQVADQERKHARLMLDRLGSGRRGRQGGDEAGARGRTAAKKDATSMSILRLLSKAMKSDA